MERMLDGWRQARLEIADGKLGKIGDQAIKIIGGSWNGN